MTTFVFHVITYSKVHVFHHYPSQPLFQNSILVQWWFARTSSLCLVSLRYPHFWVVLLASWLIITFPENAHHPFGYWNLVLRGQRVNTYRWNRIIDVNRQRISVSSNHSFPGHPTRALSVKHNYAELPRTSWLIWLHHLHLCSHWMWVQIQMDKLLCSVSCTDSLVYDTSAFITSKMVFHLSA